jgi:membrane-associated phospholipid phosphatase
MTLSYLAVFSLLPIPQAFLLDRLEALDDRGRWIPGLPGWRLALRQFQRQFCNLTSIASAIMAGVAIALIVNTYGSWKRVMPRVAPFSWDERLAHIDRMVHLGSPAWQILQPIAGSPNVTLLFDYLYFTWLPFTFASIGWLLWTRRRDLRIRGLLGVAFVWLILGNGIATLFSSAGPAYYGRLVPGPDPFVPLMGYLDRVASTYHEYTREMQEALWWLHIRGRTDLYTGISAMPSVHVAMATLFSLIGWERNRLLGITFGGYALLILLAAVHLGWHYAIDGYVSAGLVWLFWRVLKKALHTEGSKRTAVTYGTGSAPAIQSAGT